MRFHQAVAFLEVDQMLELCQATDGMGYAGIYVSDHIFYPKDLQSWHWTYQDGKPIWAPETPWPDCWCLVSAMAAVTKNLHFTSGVYIAPARDLFTVAKAVGTAAVISHNRVHLGVGPGWCKEEFDATGQDFHTRGRRLNDMIPALRALWHEGWVEYHGAHYDVPPVMMLPAPTEPIPIYGGGQTEPALRRAATICDGWLCADAYTTEQAWHYLGVLKQFLQDAGRADDPYRIYMAVRPDPGVALYDLYRRLEEAGVTDTICPPWMIAEVSERLEYRSTLDAKLRATEEFATEVIARMS